MPPGFDRLESFGHDELTEKHCYFRCSGLLMLMGSKFLIKMTRLQNIKITIVFCDLVIFIKNFDPNNIGGLEHLK